MGRSTGLLVAAILASAVPARGFVPIPVGGHPGELDVNAQVSTERGKYEPNENQASYIKLHDFYEYKLGVGYTWGDVGPLEFFSTRLEATYFSTPAERNDPSVWQVEAPGTPPTPGFASAECKNGATYLGNGVCEFHPADQGTLVSATVSAALVHDPKFAFGVYLRGTVPFSMDLDKFSNPRIDYFAGGTQLGVELTPWLSYEALTFLGSGTRPFGKQQNGAVAVTNLLHFSTQRWLLPWKAGIKVGPYFEGDINERFDARYDAAYSPQTLPQAGATGPAHQRDRIRAMRFAVALLPYFLITEHVSVEAGYVQKFFGYDARATQAWYLGVRGLFDLGK